MNQESQRVAETKGRIREAFFDLYAEKKIERISIKEITDKAQLNRGTFYVYYKDIYDLLENAENEIIGELKEIITKVLVKILRDEDVVPFLPPVEFYRRNSKLLRALMGPGGDPYFVHKIKKIIKKTLRETFQREQVPQLENLEYVMEYITSAQLGMISYWLVENNMALPVAELGEMIKQLSLHGPVGYLKMQVEGQQNHVVKPLPQDL